MYTEKGLAAWMIQTGCIRFSRLVFHFSSRLASDSSHWLSIFWQIIRFGGQPSCVVPFI